jgi:hypothetical protein
MYKYKFPNREKRRFQMKRIVFIILAIVIMAAAMPALAGGRHPVHRSGGHGNFWPGVIVGGLAVGLIDAFTRPPAYQPPPVYVSPPAPYYQGAYDQAYMREMERLRQEEYRERQRLEMERAMEDARRDFYGGYYRR